MRVLFVFPCVGWTPFFHAGIAHLSAVLKREGHQRRLVYLNDYPGFEAAPPAALKAAAQFKPDLICVSIYSGQLQLARDVARDLKEASQCPVVCGGPHAQADPKSLARDGFWDFICVGEGETPLVELCRRMAAGEKTGDIAGLWAVSPEGVVENPVASLEEAAALPPKDYEIFPYQEIIDACDGQSALLTKRGCSFRCGDCVNRAVADEYREKSGLTPHEFRFVRRRPVEDVVAEISFLLSAYRNIRLFVMEDDVFTDDKEYVIKFGEAYRGATSIPFVCNGGPKSFDTEIARCLKWAGCRLVRFNIRSGSEAMRKAVLKRVVSTEDILKAIEVCRKENLPSSVAVTFGFPGEKREDIVESIRFLGLATPSRLRWNAYFPFPGTELCEAAARGGGAQAADATPRPDAMSAPVLDFGVEQNLFLDKVFTLLPWYVNACSELPCAQIYDALIRWIDDLPSEAWKRAKEKAHSAEEAVSGMLNEGNLLHYCLRFGKRVAVRSDAL